MRRALVVTTVVIGTGPALAQPLDPPAPPEEIPSEEVAAPEAPPSPPEPTTPAATPREARPAAPATPAERAGARPVIEPRTSAAVAVFPAQHPGGGFRFGSYGRVVAGGDLRGGKPEKIRVAARAPRIVEGSYLELDLSYGFIRPSEGSDGDLVIRPVITLAFDGTLFHDTGQFDARPALRNVYLDAYVSDRLLVWGGSRMYRGDDIYLLDFWPLDDQNTVGGGFVFRQPVIAPDDHDPSRATHSVEAAAHVGVNRLNHPFTFQEIDVPDPAHGSTTIVQLNRQRVVASATATYLVAPRGGIGGKAKFHGEIHTLPAGERKRVDGTFESLPADSGMLVGGQLGAFGFAPEGSPYRRHVNLFVRYAKGLAAFDELAPPTSFGPDLRSNRASELSFALSANWDHALGSVMIGALSRRFVDADRDEIDFDDGWEYTLNARPLVRTLPDLFFGADVSYQARFPRGVNPRTLVAADASVFQIAPMLVYSPIGASGYDRPQLRLVYRAAHLDQGARDLYVPEDPRHTRPWVHFLGLQVEWWFNSFTYR
jgi:hypothetical protein